MEKWLFIRKDIPEKILHSADITWSPKQEKNMDRKGQGIG